MVDLGLAGLTKAHAVVPRVGTAFGNGQIDADITLVAEQVAEAVGTKFLAEGGLDPTPFQIPDNFRFCFAAGVALINLTDNSPLVSRLA